VDVYFSSGLLDVGKDFLGSLKQNCRICSYKP
jgi:hypothetical protein